MDKHRVMEIVEKEFVAANAAQAEGNDGKVRVCARRAAGNAIAFYLASFPAKGWGSDALHLLMHLKDDPAFPPEIRSAAERLTTKISERFTYPFSTDPVADARWIIEWMFANARPLQ